MPARWTSKFQIKPNSWVFVPTEETVQQGKQIKSLIEERWKAPNYYYHLRDGGHVKALKSHIGHSSFIHLDIRDFFGCINGGRITRNLRFYFGYTKSREMAIASTVRLPKYPEKKYILPFGFVQSPIIASMCLNKSKLGRFLNRLNNDPDISVSVYMDDIIISSNNAAALGKILDEVKVNAEAAQFPLNPKKEEGPAKTITAFNIELSAGSLRLTEGRYTEFYEALNTSEDLDKHQGIIGYVSSINQEQADNLASIGIGIET